LFIKRTISELLFEGYEDELLTIGEAYLGQNEKMDIPMDRFGWFYKVNSYYTPFTAIFDLM
jgi:hypothetical protein